MIQKLIGSRPRRMAVAAYAAVVTALSVTSSAFAVQDYTDVTGDITAEITAALPVALAGLGTFVAVVLAVKVVRRILSA